MARPQNHPILAQLRSARTTQEQTVALRALKNDIIGHVQKKEEWIELHVLKPIVATIENYLPSQNSIGKHSSIQLFDRPLHEEEATRLQALQLVSSFAHGGPSFLKPILAADALPAILSNISPYTNNPHIVVASLRALADITDAAALVDPTDPHNTKLVASYVFSRENLKLLNAILSSSQPCIQSQVALAAGLITRLCQDEKHQHALTMAGILDSLAARLASFAVRDGYVLPGAAGVAQNDGLFDAFPEPAPYNAKLGPILEAITAILGDSKYRANRLVHAPATLAVFPCLQPIQDPDSDSLMPSRHLNLTAMECVLPNFPAIVSRPTSASHSAFATPDRPSSASSRNNSKAIPHYLWDPNLPQLKPSESEPEDIESPLIPWLVLQVRSRTGHERLMAASVLTCLYRAGLGSKDVREHSIGLLVVPILIDMISKYEQTNNEASFSGKLHATNRAIFESAPLVLARLIVDCEYLQKAAFECGAVKVLTKLLRRAYTPIDALNRPKMWCPFPDSGMDVDRNSQLGPPGQNAVQVHLIKLRESTLKAIGALAGGKEEYRKALVKEDMVPYVVESLAEFPRKPQPPPSSNGNWDKDRSVEKESTSNTVDPSYGKNPLSVIVAACHAVRMLSRSVSVLRTTIVDYGVALPILQFMNHPDITLQIAATAALANLVMEVSPVRELLIEKDIMPKLCEQAHSKNSSLRLSAMWALKHLIDSESPEFKKTCLDELQPDWLCQLIDDDNQDAHMSRSRDTNDENMDEDSDSQSGEEPHRWVCGNNGSFTELDASLSTRMRQAEDRLSAVRESELNPCRRARNQEVAIQEQALNFLRNFIGRPPAGTASEVLETTEMIDHLFTHIGQMRLFELFTAKFRPKMPNLTFSRGRTSESRVFYPQGQTMAPVIYVLVHIAASDSRHRSIITSQTDLLKLIAQQTSNKDREVRIALCHLISNLTWEDDAHERENSQKRALELKKVGFLSKMEKLEKDDKDLDVRERAKLAVEQLRNAAVP